MALTVEDGTGLAASDSYVSLADFETFIANRNITTTATDAAKEAALREATSFVDAGYLFPSTPLLAAQALSFPRFSQYYIEGKLIDIGVPAKLEEAVCLLANEALSGSLTPMDDTSAIKRIREKVDVIEEETEYAGAKGARKFIAVDRLLAQIGGNNRGGSASLVRS